MATARDPYEPIIIGADVGNATTTIHSRPGGRGAFLPSFVATARIGAYEGLSKIPTDRHHITYDGQHAIVGEDAPGDLGGESLLGYYAPGDEWRRYVDPRSRACLLAGVSAAYVEADQLGVTLATGMPLSIYQAHADAVRAFYGGAHRYSYNGHARALVIKEVKVYGEGREVLRLIPAAERRGKIAVHDLGGRTYNVLFFTDGALVGYRTFDHGVERMLDAIPSVERSAGGRWRLLRELRASARGHAPIRAAIDAQIGAALVEVERKVNLPAVERHLLIGGGAPFLAPVLKRRYGVAADVLNGDAPERANAIAYALAASEVA